MPDISVPWVQMARRLDGPIAAPVWPAGLHLKPFTEAMAKDAHALLALAYADGGGSVPAFEDWRARLRGDGEYDPALCFAVCDRHGDLIGFAQCWTSGFVKDVGVHPDYRRHGIGRALLLHVFRIFQERGATAIALKVETDNPSGAMRLYESLGMSRVP